MADHDARRRAAVHFLSLAGFLVLWAFVASDLLPGPLAVWRAFLVEIAVENYFGHLGATLARVAAAFAAARNGLALVWKIVLVVELLGRPNGVGFQLHVYFQLFDVATILAYPIGFIVVVQAIKILLLDLWQRRAKRWRR